ncbi:multicopper oxidase family protein [Paenibacillus wenxiniae]|uniref:Multicopper oxidase family protein n=1 Tax=Paenibacillus wenxiniae TaxID=1636843 RepID=A0ABW4RR32_9BACL
MTNDQLWTKAGWMIAFIIGMYRYDLLVSPTGLDTKAKRNTKRWSSFSAHIHRYRTPVYFKIMTLLSLCLLLISLSAPPLLAQSAAAADQTSADHSSVKDLIMNAPPLATNAVTPGVMDADTDALTKTNILAQNRMAADIMNEQSLQPHLLPNGTKQFTLTAAPLVWNLYEQKNIQAWGYNGQISGPLLRVKVGDTVSIVLKNELPEPTSLGFSGISVPATMGGLPQPTVAPHASLTYSFKITSDMVGTHSYFSTTDMDKQINHGLHGVLLVDPAQGKEYPDADVNALFDIGSFVVDQKVEENVFTLNGKPYPNSPELSIQQGQHVLVRIVNSSAESFHAMHLHGYTFKLVAQDGHHLNKPVSMNVVSVAPEETVDIEFTANAPGIWMFHCHILDHTMNPDDDDDEMGGLMTNFVVHSTGANQSMPAGSMDDMGSMGDMNAMANSKS